MVAILVVTGIGIASNQLLPGNLAAENQSQVVMTVGDMLATNAKVAAAKTVLSKDQVVSVALTLIDEITETQGNSNRECVGQGLANIVCGLFGGMGGCAMIGQSLINVESGGRGRISGVFAACCMLTFVLFFSISS